MRKEIPILFSTPMVQAIMAGRKTMTRRIIEMDDLIESPDRFKSAGDSREFDVPRPAIKYDDRIWFSWELKNSNARTWIKRCKYKPGDLLWVRENFKMVGWDFDDGTAVIEYADGEKIEFETPDGDDEAYQWIVKQYEKLLSKDIIQPSKDDDEGPMEFTEKKHPFSPSIHIPKWCSRIWLQVTNVRAERLQDINEDDAIAEGVESWVEERMKSKPTHYKIYSDFDNPDDPAMYSSTAKVSFETLWRSINGPDSWDVNPWVWVIEFKVLSTTGKPTI